MTLFRRLRFAPDAAVGLCRTCSWATVRRGFGANEAETFCRLVGPNSRVRFAVRDCSDYCDRRVSAAVAEERRFGFVTEIKLEDGETIRISPDSTKPSRET
jgi:hypothetical protein